MKVFEALRVNPLGKELADRLERDVRREAQNRLEHFRDLFPHFTDHALRHSEGVIAILDWLMPDEIKEKNSTSGNCTFSSLPLTSTTSAWSSSARGRPQVPNGNSSLLSIRRTSIRPAPTC